MKRTVCLLCVLLVSVSLYAQIAEDLSFTVSPSANIPIAPKLDDGTEVYSIGGGLNFRTEYSLPFLPSLFASGNIDFDLIPLNGSDTSVTFLSGGAGLGFRFSPVSRLTLKTGGYGGLYLGIIEQGSVRNPFAAAFAEAAYQMSPAASIGLGGVYKHNLTPDGPVYQGVGVTLGMQYHLGSRRKNADLYIEPYINPIFPLFYSYYDKNPAGTLSLANNELSPLHDVQISFFVKQYMEQPKLCAEYKTLKPGQDLEIPVYALFTDNIFRITEGTKVAGEITVEYSYIGKPMTSTLPITVTINNRNAMTWDDDRKAAAFVTSKDPAVLNFAKNVAASMRSNDIEAVNTNFRTAMAIFEALHIYGIGYVIDPASPYSVLSEQTDVLDFIQFPNQTLAYKAGDCDDITILYSALLEAVGIETAFITAPGHIYMAFNLGMAPASAKSLFSSTEDLLIKDDETWIPVEITLMQEGFLKAWKIGAKEWRETSTSATAGFYPVRDSWQLYEPVGFAQGTTAIVLPDSRSVVSQYKLTLDRFIDREITPQVETITAELNRSHNEVKYRNKLGILYARYGLLDKAVVEFKAVIARRNYVPAFINLGNVYYLKDEMQQALSYYQRALQIKPDSPTALLGVARSSYQLDDYDTVNTSLAKLENESPEMAAKFSYLGSGSADTGRASQALVKEINEWDEEE